jgi:hypothetical protein
MKTSKFAALLSMICAFALVGLGTTTAAHAKQVGQINFEDTVRVASEDVRLTGAALAEGVGIYKRSSNRVAMGLYLKDIKRTTPEVISVAGPRRLAMVMLQDVDGESLSRSFITSIQRNVERAERGKITSQLMKFGEVFAAIGIFKKGDVFHLDWIPAHDTTVITMNGKIIAEIPDRGFSNALLLCFLGERPIDPKLKSVFLGESRD